MRSHGVQGLRCLLLALSLPPILPHSTPHPPKTGACHRAPCPTPSAPPPFSSAGFWSSSFAFFPFQAQLGIGAGRGGERLTCLCSGHSRAGHEGATGLSPPLAPTGSKGVSFLAEPLTHHLRGGGVSGKVVHSRSR